MWPQALITELASRRCIIFLGAGASTGCVSSLSTRNPLTWGDFLLKLRSLMHEEDDKHLVDDLINKEKYLDSAEIMFGSISPADFTGFIRSEFVNPKFNPSNIHKSVLKIDPKIIITTNYDDIYDKYCSEGQAVDGYNVCRYYEMFWFSVNWTFGSFVINNYKRRKIHAKKASQLQPSRKGFHFTSPLG